MRQSIWTADHVDHLLTLLRDDDNPTTRELSTRMSRHFKARITTTHITTLLSRMRKPNDELYRRDTPWLQRGAKYQPYRT